MQTRLSKSKYFKENPTKVLGTLHPSTDRFGKAIIEVRGSMTDVQYGIEAPTVRRFEHFKAGQKLKATASAKLQSSLDRTKGENSGKSKRKSKAKTAKQKSTPATLLPLADSIKKYNPQLSKEEITVWVTYQSNRGLFDAKLIAKNAWKQFLVKDADYLRSQVGKLTAFDGKEDIPNVLFYSGNIYEKLKNLRAQKSLIITAIGEELFNQQIQKLEAVLPQKLKITDGEEGKLTLSPFDKIFRDFKVNVLADGTEFPEAENLIEIFKWNYLGTLTSDDFIFEKQKSSQYDIRQHWLKRGRFSRGTDESEKAARKRAAQTIGARLFDRFLFEMLTREDRKKLEYLWNSTRNNYVEPDWSKIPVGFEINKYFKGGLLQIRPAQREGVAFLNINGTGIIAYDVGVGKTMTAVLYIADMMSKGLCRRPLIVVPNPTYEKWLGELQGVFAKKEIKDKEGKILHQKGDLIAEGILPQYKYNDYYNLGAGHLEKAKNEASFTLQVEEYSITVITYEGLSKIGFKQESEKKLITSIKAILSQGEVGRDAAIVEEQISAMVDRALDKSEIYIEDMGIDAIVVDEAHNFKNLFTQVRGEATVGEYGETGRESNHYELQGKKPSARAIKLFMLNRYVQLQHNRRNTIGLTATPFTNSPLEIYSMQALFDYDGLKEHGIENIVDYFNTFIDESYEAVWTSRGRFEQRAVIRGFNNLPTMQAIIFKYILYKTGEEANISRPEKIVLPLKNDEKGVQLPIEYQANTEIPATEEQLGWFKEIAAFARGNASELDMYYETDGKGNIPGRDLIAINAAQLATLSPLLLPWRKVDEGGISAEEFMASSPKLRYVVDCIKSVKAYHENNKEEVSGQVIYSNRGTKFFPHIKTFLLENVGYKDAEVQIIIGSTSTKKKEKIKQDFLAGKVKVIIGSATIREGIDLQKRSTVLYNCYLDWNPTDIKQLEGRIWRFGNIFSHVRIVVPLIENSFDIFLNQKLGEKTSRVNNIWSKAGRSTVLKLEELNPDELKKGLITDVRELVKMLIEEQSQELFIQDNLLKSYVKQLTDAAAEKQEVNRLKRKLDGIATRAKEAWAYSPTTEKKVITRIAKMKSETLPQLYRLVKAYADTREWSEKYDLEGTVDEHIKKLKKLERTERNILAKNDLTIKDDFTALIEKYQQQIEQIEKDIKQVTSPQNQLKLMLEMTAEKEAKQMASKPTEERVEEFKRLNYLLECRDEDMDGQDDQGNVCTIYGINRGEGEQNVKVHAKKDWEISFADYQERQLAALPEKERARKEESALDMEIMRHNHHFAVVKALERGENVPPEVEKEYAGKLPKKEKNGTTKSSKTKGKKSTNEKSKVVPKFRMSKTLKDLIPKHQQQVIKDWNDELKHNVLAPLNAQLKAIPKSAKSSTIDRYIVYAHYFYGSSDWFIVERDGEHYLYGYVILNGDSVMSEIGGIGLRELTEHGGIELDFYWTPKYLAEAKYQADPDFFREPDFSLAEDIRAGEEQAIPGIQVEMNAPPNAKMLERIKKDYEKYPVYRGRKGMDDFLSQNYPHYAEFAQMIWEVFYPDDEEQKDFKEIEKKRLRAKKFALKQDQAIRILEMETKQQA
jgi:hypothetical protein